MTNKFAIRLAIQFMELKEMEKEFSKELRNPNSKLFENIHNAYKNVIYLSNVCADVYGIKSSVIQNIMLDTALDFKLNKMTSVELEDLLNDEESAINIQTFDNFVKEVILQDHPEIRNDLLRMEYGDQKEYVLNEILDDYNVVHSEDMNIIVSIDIKGFEWI